MRQYLLCATIAIAIVLLDHIDLTHAASFNNSSTPIKIRSIAGKALQESYVKHQSPGNYMVVSNNDFVYIPGLNQAFYV